MKRYDSFQGLGQLRKAAAGKEVFLMLSSLWNKNAFEKEAAAGKNFCSLQYLERKIEL